MPKKKGYGKKHKPKSKIESYVVSDGFVEYPVQAKSEADAFKKVDFMLDGAVSKADAEGELEIWKVKKKKNV